MHSLVFPFAAIVGQQPLKTALLLAAVNPAIGGVLIRGEKGTAKSTTVRAFAALLPEISVVLGCPFSCDPDAPKDACPWCRRQGERILRTRRRIRVVTLPLNATEDRVVGGIDFGRTIQEGRRVLQPGLLAKAHRGILYVDEVNLLDDHIVDILLDAAASGRNVIEREGIHVSHASRFILVGTMNPEEGELRPQLLDRFGVCVEIVSEKDPQTRALLMQRRESFDADPQAFIRAFQEDSLQTTSRIVEAKHLLPQVHLSRNLRKLIAELCTENHVAGHRADLVIEAASRAHAALNGRNEVTVTDIQEVAKMALIHRRREAIPPPPPPHPKENNAQTDPPSEASEDPSEHSKESNPENQQENPSQPLEPTSRSQEQEESRPENTSSAEPSRNDLDRNAEGIDRIFEIGETFQVQKFSSAKDRMFRRGSGRRSRTRIAQKQGRYIQSTTVVKTGDIALDATLRAAAPHQKHRKRTGGLAVVLRNEDLREKIRERRIGNFLLFLVDASGSMGARGRMAASKGAILSLLLDAYQKRDRVAMISFRKTEAVVNLPPTSSIELAAQLLREMPVGGRTPLSAGIAKAHDMIRNHLLREPTARPIVLFITDGKTNVALGGKKPVEEAVEMAEKWSMDPRIRFIVVDTENQELVRFGLARRLAQVMKAQYYKIEDLKSERLLHLVKEHDR